MEKIYILCPVSMANDKIREELQSYVSFMEDQGFEVYYPARDTEQGATPMEICRQNFKAIREADRVDIFYSDKSLGSHLDIGCLVEEHLRGNKKEVNIVSGTITNDTTGYQILELINQLN